MRKFYILLGLATSIAFIVLSLSFTKPLKNPKLIKYHHLLSSGGIVGYSAAGCTCHDATANASVGVSLTGLPSSPIVGVTYPLTFTVTGPNSGAGFNLLASDGTFSNLGSNVQNAGGELTHTSPKSLSSGTVSFTFDWTPTTSGNTTFSFAANNVNLDATNVGDIWNNGTIIVPVQTLPVKLTYFKGYNSGNNTSSILWKAEQEINFGKYELEYSCNGITYTHVTTILPQRNSTIPKTYSYQHNNNCSNAKSYYRLKMINLDGTYEYSSIITISKQNIATNAFVFPNPITTGQKTVSLYIGKKDVAQIQIINNEGKIVTTYTGITNLIETDLVLPANLSAGNYYVKIIYKNGSANNTIFLVQ